MESASSASQNVKPIQILVFTVGDKTFGVEYRLVKTIVEFSADADDDALLDDASGIGSLKLSDQKIPMIDVGHFLQIYTQPSDVSQAVIANMPQDGLYAAFIVSSVVGVTSVVPTSLMKFHLGLFTCGDTVFKSVFEFKSEFIPLVDLPELFMQAQYQQRLQGNL